MGMTEFGSAEDKLFPTRKDFENKASIKSTTVRWKEANNIIWASRDSNAPFLKLLSVVKNSTFPSYFNWVEFLVFTT